MKRRVFIILLAVFLINGAATLRISRYYSYACEEYAENGLSGKILSEINRNIAFTLNESNIKTNDILKPNYDENGNLKSINIESYKLNLLALEISQAVYRSIDSAETTFGFPIGNATGLKYLSGKGPNVGVSVIPTGAVSYELQSEFLSGGINQTLYRLNLLLNCNISVIAPFFDKDKIIETSVIIAEVLIIGDVPKVMLPFSE